VNFLGCIAPDGKPTESGRKMLVAIKVHHLPEEIAKDSGLPLFRVRSGLRDLLDAGYVSEEKGEYHLTDAGRKVLNESGKVQI
jgi:predicted transcriptional regulator